MKIVPKKFKVHSLTGRITPEMMRLAFKAVRRNRGAAGLDKVSIKMFEANLDQNLDALMKDLKSRTYQPIPLKRAYIPKGKGTPLDGQSFWGPPGAIKTHAGKYRELTLLRKRGGGGETLPLTHWCQISDIRYQISGIRYQVSGKSLAAFSLFIKLNNKYLCLL